MSSLTALERGLDSWSMTKMLHLSKVNLLRLLLYDCFSFYRLTHLCSKLWSNNIDRRPELPRWSVRDAICTRINSVSHDRSTKLQREVKGPFSDLFYFALKLYYTLYVSINAVSMQVEYYRRLCPDLTEDKM